ncbi:glycosyltransferase [Bacillus sp. 7894-2]|uniref:glycosyltransferase n=1 Tax=Bacillus sp. 7894-2 TaxID=2021695 RepID=UPI0025704EBA|nr:glycosyltransferase [Bacillus sp. 7894-2]
MMKKGINLIGYARAEFGLGEACRSAAKAFHAADIPFCIINFPHCPARQTDLTWRHKEVEGPIFKTNLFLINADQLFIHYQNNHLKKRWFMNRHNIGYWHWELPIFPDLWNSSFSIVDEVLAPTAFIRNSISQKTSKPVNIIPHSISLEIPQKINRKYFGLPDNRYLFLAMFDTRSTSARKNPAAAVEAFKLAFDKGDKSVGLVLKVNNGSHTAEELDYLKQSATGYENIYIINRILSRQEVNGLINVSNSYISLHRSEGFGLPIAEAMYLGKPVIVTNWSGNTDFTKPHNSFLVNFTLSKISKDHGPYHADQLWAEPDISHAATLMKTIAGNQQHARRIGVQGKKTIVRKFSPLTVGNMYKEHLKRLKLL